MPHAFVDPRFYPGGNFTLKDANGTGVPFSISCIFRLLTKRISGFAPVPHTHTHPSLSPLIVSGVSHEICRAILGYSPRPRFARFFDAYGFVVTRGSGDLYLFCSSLVFVLPSCSVTKRASPGPFDTKVHLTLPFSRDSPCSWDTFVRAWSGGFWDRTLSGNPPFFLKEMYTDH